MLHTSGEPARRLRCSAQASQKLRRIRVSPGSFSVEPRLVTATTCGYVQTSAGWIVYSDRPGLAASRHTHCQAHVAMTNSVCIASIFEACGNAQGGWPGSLACDMHASLAILAKQPCILAHDSARARTQGTKSSDASAALPASCGGTGVSSRHSSPSHSAAGWTTNRSSPTCKTVQEALTDVRRSLRFVCCRQCARAAARWQLTNVCFPAVSGVRRPWYLSYKQGTRKDGSSGPKPPCT